MLVLVALPLCAWDMYRHNMETHYIAWFVGGVFVLLALPITFYEVGGDDCAKVADKLDF